MAFTMNLTLKTLTGPTKRHPVGPSAFEHVLESRHVEHREDLEHFNSVSLLQTKAGGSVGSCHALPIKSETDALMKKIKCDHKY